MQYLIDYAVAVANCGNFRSWYENGEYFIDCIAEHMDEKGRCRCEMARYVEEYVQEGLDILQRAKDRIG